MGLLWDSPEDRWERIVSALLWVAGLFGAFTIYAIYSGDDWRGLVMTIAPGLLCLGLWYAARVRLDHLMSDTPTPLWIKLVGWTFSAGALATIAWLVYGLSTGRLEYREVKTDQQREEEMMRGFKLTPEALRRLNESARSHQPPPPPPDDEWPQCPDGQTLVAEPTAPERAICKALPAPDDLRLR